MRRILAAIRSVLANMAGGFRDFWADNLWPCMLAAGRVCTGCADATIDAIEWTAKAAVKTAAATADVALSIPGRIFGSGAGGDGPQAPQAAQQTTAQVRAAQTVAERQITITQTAKLIHRAAAIKSNFPERDLTELFEALPANLGGYMKALHGSEIHKLAEADIPALISHLSGNRPVPGVRTPNDVFTPPPDLKAEGNGRFRSPAADASPEQAAMMGALADRIRARHAEQPESDLRFA